MTLCRSERRSEMSNETNETIADIVADIRAQNQGLPEDSYALSPQVCDLLSLADRVEAAHKREIADEKRISDAVVQSLRDKKLEKDREVAEKDNEIARLSAALKPVLECKVMSAMTAEIAPGRSKYCATIIEEAQHIYNEGEENRN